MKIKYENKKRFFSNFWGTKTSTAPNLVIKKYITKKIPVVSEREIYKKYFQGGGDGLVVAK
jgi:hypothetical protein